jgi:hypothetical protein
MNIDLQGEIQEAIASGIEKSQSGTSGYNLEVELLNIPLISKDCC